MMRRSSQNLRVKNKKSKGQSTMFSRFRAFVFSILFILFLSNTVKPEEKEQPKVRSYKYCVLCNRTLEGKLRKGSRTLKISNLSNTDIDYLKDWCFRNNVLFPSVNNEPICARDITRLNRNKLFDLTTSSPLSTTTTTTSTSTSTSTTTTTTTTTSTSTSTQTSTETPSLILEGLIKVPESGSKCVICGVKVSAGCVKIPFFAKQELLLIHNLVVGPNSNCRICSKHLSGSSLKSDLTITRSYNPKCHLSLKDGEILINQLINSLRTEANGSFLNFDDNSLTDEEYILWTGWTKDQFDSFIPYLKDVYHSNNRSKRVALAIFWVRIKTDLSYSQIASMFNISNDPNESGRLIVSAAFNSVAQSLHQFFVPLHLGIDHLTPEEAKNHNTIFSTTFFGDKTTTIWDGTYLYLNKSSNYAKSRSSFSTQKKRSLTKFMSIVLPDGYCLDTVGPFYSNHYHNDAGITQKILNEEGFGFMNWLQESEQVVVVDLGFRNIVSYLQNLGLRVEIPSYNKNQQVTIDSNRTRLVTKVRWVVEAYHSRFKKFRFFENVQSTSDLLLLKECLRITTASLNRFRPPLYTKKEKDQEIATTMLNLSKQTMNHVAERVKNGPFSSRGGKWVELEIEKDEVDILNPKTIANFPKLTETQMCDHIFCGVYQLKQAVNYCNEHMSEKGGFTIFIHQDAPDLLRARLQSRHKNKTRYFLWVEYNKQKITGWYCQCKAGARTVGCCAHIASVIWYLGWARYQNYQPSPNINKYWKKVLDASRTGFESSGEESD